MQKQSQRQQRDSWLRGVCTLYFLNSGMHNSSSNCYWSICTLKKNFNVLSLLTEMSTTERLKLPSGSGASAVIGLKSKPRPSTLLPPGCVSSETVFLLHKKTNTSHMMQSAADVHRLQLDKTAVNNLYKSYVSNVYTQGGPPK